MTASNALRQAFLSFFEENEHLALPSSPVIPLDDPTLLFINAGMNQFKDVFLGKSAPRSPRATTSQKCVRVGGKHNDLENVGHTSRHLTFFEMLGNFSFGDYFKKEAIQFAWHVSTEIFQFDPEKIWVSVFEDDDEAYELWKSHISEKRLVRMGRKDNFWEMGTYGPCGPCSELLYDRGKSFGSAKSPLTDTDGERFLEFWNLVFMQFNSVEGPNSKVIQEPLARPSIDTGAGLERLLMLQMGARSVYETDVLRTLIGEVERLSGKTYTPDAKDSAAFRVISDHIRTLAFAIADGAQPSNTDRGYVLRKVLRRAVRYGRTLGLTEPFLYKLIPTLNQLMGAHYSELTSAKGRIEELVALEEENFIRTLKRGGNLLKSVIEKSQASKCIDGKDAFVLKDTYGFPIEEVALIAKDAGLKIDMDGYKTHEDEARALSKAAHANAAQIATSSIFETYVEENGLSTFVGYDNLSSKGTVKALVVDGEFASEITPETKEALVITDSTPFYAQMGGQTGDSGKLSSKGATFHVINTLSPFSGVIAHKGSLESGTLKVGDAIELEVDGNRRKNIRAHHSATHLIHWALTEVLGDHVRQAGSLVLPDRLRFDFNHHKALSSEELLAIERKVNAAIRNSPIVFIEEKAYDDVKGDTTIRQFFGDKYGDTVRVVALGPTKELCGGTHVESLAEVGMVKILKESSIASGVRRIEAVCGLACEVFIEKMQGQLAQIESAAGAKGEKLIPKIEETLKEVNDLKKSLKAHEEAQLAESMQALLDQSQTLGDITFLSAKVDVTSKELKNAVEAAFSSLQSKSDKAALVLACEEAGRCQLAIKLSRALVNDGMNAKKLLEVTFDHLGGRGGGRDDFATCGGQNPSGIPAAFEAIRNSLSSA